MAESQDLQMVIRRMLEKLLAEYAPEKVVFIRRMLEKLLAEYAPEKVVLFGSYAA